MPGFCNASGPVPFNTFASVEVNRCAQYWGLGLNSSAKDHISTIVQEPLAYATDSHMHCKIIVSVVHRILASDWWTWQIAQQMFFGQFRI